MRDSAIFLVLTLVLGCSLFIQREVSPEIQAAIDEGTIIPGMTREDVVDSIGRADASFPYDHWDDREWHYWSLAVAVIFAKDRDAVERVSKIPDYWSAINAGDVVKGMSRKQVEASIGSPDMMIPNNDWSDREWRYIDSGTDIIFEKNKDAVKKERKIKPTVLNGFRYSKVVPGMTPQEVLYVLGIEPTSISTEVKGDEVLEYWIYWVKRWPYWKITFRKGQVISIIDQDLIKE
jgi:outer membrane protein assembly factor BamE (lipoprotein component of BamABCDE complex)